MEFCARWLDRPIAFSTCDGSSVPDEHADPVDTATPSRSSAISSDSASMRSKLMLVVLGTRASRAPLTSVFGTADRIPFSRRSRSADRRSASTSIFCIARRAATPIPIAPGTFSVPARRFRSCLPPLRNGDRRTPRFDPQRADALRTVELVRRDGEQIDAERAHVHRNLARALHGVGVEQRPARVGDRGELGDRLNRADFVVRVHDRDERGVVGHRLAQRGRARRCRSASSGSTVVRHPRFASALKVLSTASCSMPDVMRCLRPVTSSASAAPRIAKLSASVPPLVKTISAGSAPISAATALRASSIAAFACCP